MKLKLKNVTSYSEQSFTILNLDSKHNIVYGQNGAGKSTISNFFYNKEEEIFKECECDSIENYRTIVYNTKFIVDNFFKTNEQKGIFTLSKENSDIEKTVIEKEKIRGILLDEHREKKTLLADIKSDTEKNENICIESIWSKTETLRNSKLRPLMKGSIGSKKDYYKKITESHPLNSIAMKSLENEYIEITQNQNSEITSITQLVSFDMSTDEIELLKTPIIDSSNSYLSETIKKLDNLDWVKRGKDLYLSDNTCPFCQEKTINIDFLKAIESIFDATYSDKILKISLLMDKIKNTYHTQFEKITDEINACNIVSESEKDTFLVNLKSLDLITQRNISLVQEKITNPSKSIKLEDVSAIQQKIMEDITGYNTKISDINTKVKQFKKTESNIKEKMWAGLRYLCNNEIDRFNEIKRDAIANESRINNEMAQIVEKGKFVSEEIKTLRDQVSNIEGTILSINSRLKTLGIHGFSIEKHPDILDSYILLRPEQIGKSNVYISLSEGEKTLISFLYFIECCKGKLDKSEDDNRDIFVVIDDPISSLSQNYIYDIASMIHFEIMQDAKIKKTLVLTHNLYFFHELIKLAPKSEKTFKNHYNLTRITKNAVSLFSAIERNTMQNEYQSLWQILKDTQVGKANKILIPNIMRNILEYYFAFVHKSDELQETLNALARDKEHANFRPFYRFINRGSHSDSININDMGEIAPELYLEQFKEIFSILGDEQHYIKMINEKDEESATA